ncbi:MAG: hypothetical protein EXQ92_06475 [Alphaproteobacteria bacterium]|nr:hypothetical protein [Alphaproteobacteria bacterium]
MIALAAEARRLPARKYRRQCRRVDGAPCDRLEASLTDTDATRRRLLDALLAEALTPGMVQEEAA